MPHRRRLPNRRPHEITTVTHWDQRFTVGIGRECIDTAIQELFINVDKSGTQIESLLRDAAVLISIALQYGAPLYAMRDAITRDIDANPTSPVGTILDMLCK